MLEIALNIHLGVIALWVFSFILCYVTFKALQDDEMFGAFLLFCCAVGVFLWGYHEAKPETQIDRDRQAAKNAEVRRQQETPHVVREADGCKVYAFMAGNKWHYFTRCLDSTVRTDTTYTECTGSGKTRSCRDVVETIETSK